MTQETTNLMAMKKTARILIAEWISTITVFLVCFVFLFYKMEKQSDKMDDRMSQQSARTDKLYEMFIEVVKATKQST